jgi:metal-responsive CopG/Arc/MetJ family transcriptional regulator
MERGKKVLIALPPAFLEEIDAISHSEHRSRSDLVREALRQYLFNFKKKQQEISRIDTDGKIYA